MVKTGQADGLLEFQNTARRFQLNANLRSSGWGCIIFGVIAVVAGFAQLKECMLNILLVGLGGLLFIGGLINILKPTRPGLIVDGIALLMVGMWNFLIGLLTLVGGGSIGIWFFLGIFQVVWGVRRFFDFPYYQGIDDVKPEPAALSETGNFLTHLERAEPKTIRDVLVFLTGFSQWRGKLEQERVTFVRIPNDRAYVVPPGQFEFDVIKDRKNTVEMEIRLAGLKLKGSMTKESYDNLLAWKHGLEDAPPVDI
jgi:hypothetical protein